MSIKNFRTEHILILILLSSLFLRLYRLDYPQTYIFDEVYHAFTAKEYLNGNHEAWEWWTNAPKGVAFEWTHPPLAKEIMALSMFILHTKQPWAYRLPGVLLGTLSVYLVYLLADKLLKNRHMAQVSAFAFSIDGLNFVQSRTAMNDIYYVTFILLGLLLFLNKKYALSAIIFGLAISSKWAALYIYLIFIPLLLVQRKILHLLYFIAITILIYLITYIPFFLLSHTPEQFIHLQQQMFWYHTNLKAAHDYASAFWSWPLNLYPVWYFVDYQQNTTANIFASGNPALFWVGTISVILTAYEAIKKKSLYLLIIITGFLIFWLPWAISPRIMFLYHFAPCVPFMCICLGYQLGQDFSDKSRRKLILFLLAAVGLSFILIFPFLTGIHLPKNIVNLFFSINLAKNPF